MALNDMVMVSIVNSWVGHKQALFLRKFLGALATASVRMGCDVVIDPPGILSTAALVPVTAV